MSDGKPLRVHIEKIKEITGKPAEGYEEMKVCPPEVQHIWHWFLDLHSTRNSGFGLQRITFTEIYSYFKLKGFSPFYDELELLREMDIVAVQILSEQQEKQSKKNSRKNVVTDD